MEDGQFNVVVYEPGQGYRILDSEGIFKLADGTYANCAIVNSGNVVCKDITEVGNIMTVDDEIVTCTRNEKKEIECIEANVGGYYYVNDKLMECQSNDSNDKLVCVEVEKEGYFISASHETLFDCIKKPEEEKETDEIEISSFRLGSVNKLAQIIPASERVSANVTARQEDEDGESAPNDESEEIEEKIPDPMAVTCEAVECVEGSVIQYSKNEKIIELYVCVRQEKETTDENNSVVDGEEEVDIYRWIAHDCESGSHRKLEISYSCEANKVGIDESKIEKPNVEKTVEEMSKTTTTSKEEKPTTTSKEEEKPTTSSESEATATTTEKPSENTAATTTTTKKTTTAAPAPTQGGSGAIGTVSVPSMALYLFLLILAFLIHY